MLAAVLLQALARGECSFSRDLTGQECLGLIKHRQFIPAPKPAPKRPRHQPHHILHPTPNHSRCRVSRRLPCGLLRRRAPKLHRLELLRRQRQGMPGRQRWVLPGHSRAMPGPGRVARWPAPPVPVQCSDLPDRHLRRGVPRPGQGHELVQDHYPGGMCGGVLRQWKRLRRVPGQ